MFFGKHKGDTSLVGSQIQRNGFTEDTLQNLIESYRQIDEHNRILERKKLGPDEDDIERTKSLYRSLELLEDKMLDPQKGLYVGYGIELLGNNRDIQPIYLQWPNITNNMQVFGTTRQGKTKTLIHFSKQIMLAGQNLFIVEPKGSIGQEVLSYTIEHAYEAGRLEDLVFSSAAHPDLSMKTNPLHLMTDEELAAHIASLVKSSASAESSSELFFNRTVYKIVLTILTANRFKETLADISGSKKDEAELAEFIKWFVDDKYQGHFPKKFKGVNTLLHPDVVQRLFKKQKLNFSKTAFTQVRSLINYRDIALAAPYEKLKFLREDIAYRIIPSPSQIGNEMYEKLTLLKENAVAMLDDCVKGSAENFGAITGSLSAAIMMLSTGNLGELFCQTRVNPLSLAMQDPNKGVLGVFMPYSLKFPAVCDMSVRVFYGLFQSSFARVGVSGRGIKKRLYVMIDEGQSILFPGVESGFNKLAGLGTTFMLFVQSPADQDVKLGKDLARVVRDNINTNGIYKLNDPVSREIASLMIGTRAKTETTYASRGEAGGMFQVVRTSGNPVVFPDKFSKLKVGQAYWTHQDKAWLVRMAYQEPAKLEMIMPVGEDEKRIEDLNRQYNTYMSDIGQFSEAIERENLGV